MKYILLTLSLYITISNAKDVHKGKDILKFNIDTPVESTYGYDLYQLNCVNSNRCKGDKPNYVECIKHEKWEWICTNDIFDVKVINVVCDWENDFYIKDTCQLYYTLDEVSYLNYYLIFLGIILMTSLGIVYKYLELNKLKLIKSNTITGKPSEVTHYLNNMRNRKNNYSNYDMEEIRSIV